MFSPDPFVRALDFHQGDSVFLLINKARVFPEGLLAHGPEPQALLKSILDRLHERLALEGEHLLVLPKPSKPRLDPFQFLRQLALPPEGRYLLGEPEVIRPRRKFPRNLFQAETTASANVVKNSFKAPSVDFGRSVGMKNIFPEWATATGATYRANHLRQPVVAPGIQPCSRSSVDLEESGKLVQAMRDAGDAVAKVDAEQLASLGEPL